MVLNSSLNWYLNYKILLSYKNLKENRRDPLSLLSKKLTTLLFKNVKSLPHKEAQSFYITPDEIPKLNEYKITYVTILLKYIDTYKYNNGYPFRVIGQFGKKNSNDIKSHFLITIEINNNVDINKYYSYLYNRILEDLRHELEHSNQAVNNRYTPENLSEEKLNIPSDIINSNDYKENIEFFNKIVYAYGYIGSMLESEAFVEGFMARSKNERKPIEAIVENHLNTDFFYPEYMEFIHENINKNTNIGKFLIQAYNTIREKILNVVKSRYPLNQTGT